MELKGYCLWLNSNPKLAGEEGIEPSNGGIKIRCLNQLGDSPEDLPKTKTTRPFA
jgi:hypothetical protein